uniref:Uncharacterized protein LOC105042235 n=1 Tax=Elaeis guineensis var. tenera TaxID=51953 RepID=A0A6I9R4H8_ELAGV|nr:uncharacterized protein LOC105042235 [Elaeis guineensis]
MQGLIDLSQGNFFCFLFSSFKHSEIIRRLLLLLRFQSMGEGLKEMFRKVSSPRAEDADELCESASLSTADSGDSTSSSSSDLTDDATSSSPTPFSPSSNASKLDSDGPVFQLSSLMAQLPIKRGLSKYYQGKSQSFTSLSDARCIEDLAKKEIPYKKKMKPCKSYAGNLDASQKSFYTPGPYNKTIAKKTTRGSCSSLVARRSSNSPLTISKPPPIPVNKNL